MDEGAQRCFVESAGDLGGRLISKVKSAVKRLGPLGWKALLKQHGLDLSAKDLVAELSRPLPKIDRTLSGFEDFSAAGRRGIEPGSPSRSLLFHAFASPRVMDFQSGGRSRRLKGFPTIAEIEAIENYVYGADPPSIEDLRARAAGARLAIVVFASEYRAAVGTVHRRHADMVYSRTGIARVGTRSPRYDGAARGFLPFVAKDDKANRTLPCRYSAYVACLVPGEKSSHGPLRHIDSNARDRATSGRSKQHGGLRPAPAALQAAEPGDDCRVFWTPLHKLFSGKECIRGREINVRMSASHLNEKIRRAHLKFLSSGHNADWSEPDISEPPFIFRQGIADFSADAEDGSWLLCPHVHKGLTEPATYKGKPLTYLVPKSPDTNGPWRAYQSSLNLLPQPSGARSAPEYLHARHAITEDGKERDLNEEPEIINLVGAGGYRARHYVDFTGDGWVDVDCAEVALELPRRLPA
jgi:hypothetical protein